MSSSAESNEVGRRTLLKGAAAGALGLGLSGALARVVLADDDAPAAATAMKRRVLGRTGREVSVIGVGGGGINPQNSGLLKAAWDNGIDFFDVAASYGNGQAEAGVGKFLQGFQHRDKLFINTKASAFKPPQGTSKQVYEAFKAKLHESLTRMKTDYVDMLMWPHGAQDTAFLQNEAMRDAFRKLKEEGLIRHFATSTHKNYKAVGEAIVDDGFYDVVLIVANICTQNAAMAGQPAPGGGRRRGPGRSIEDTTTFLKKAKEKNVGVMAMKVANQGFMTPATDGLLATAFPAQSTASRHQKLYTYALHQAGVSNVIVGMRSALHLKEAIAVGSA